MIPAWLLVLMLVGYFAWYGMGVLHERRRWNKRIKDGELPGPKDQWTKVEDVKR